MFVVDFVQDLICYHEKMLLSILVPSWYPLKISGLCIRQRRDRLRLRLVNTGGRKSESMFPAHW